MAMDDNESCSSRTVDSSPTHPRQQRQKLEVFEEVLRRLKDLNNEEVDLPGFDDELWSHFARLPARYALDVNAERAEDVLTHKRLLQLAHDPASRPALEVRLVQVPSISDGNFVDSALSSSPREDDAQSPSDYPSRQSIHPPPAFGSSPNLEGLALEASKTDEDGSVNANSLFNQPMHEITFSTDDKPKLLSQLTSLLAEIGLNIEEAHAFSTTDGYSLDVFVVKGWPYEETEQLRHVLQNELLKIEDGQNKLRSRKGIWNGMWYKILRYKGTYCSQEVAIKILKPERVNENMQQEFAQEVYIMRKVRHKNVVQFIGASTRPPSLCIVTEFMSGGSVYDFLHKQKGVFKLPTLLKVAIDVSKGMNYLHQNNIIHRDLKAANLLMDENDWNNIMSAGLLLFGLVSTTMKLVHQVVKVADFGVARVQLESGVMTAETGTYRWMAPEIPYEYLTPLQAAVGVVQKVGEEGEVRKEKSGRFFSALRKGHH
ncbi:hypothetical protein GIB67_028208 [Kingdonia uniflora]|uniref:Uncharacterized protein n=1 Tax=Kingdonia uniflora TaxID=39325 RepID=A0A7J7KZ78_9MAGN|nr:hypothetical protein GIB67_028208 [Kingdonia uniflora]